MIVIHLNGPFSAPNIFNVGKAISFGEFKALVSVAIARDPKAIVLKIDSGGGRQDQMDLIIEELIKIQTDVDDCRVVAWVNFGGSAAALTALACREIVMMPQGRIGAATAVLADGEAVGQAGNALDKKLEAMRDARREQIASITGRPVEIQLAMELPEHQFWHHPEQGFSLKRKVFDDQWRAYDTDAGKPLALSAQAMVEVGMASGLARDAASLLKVLKLPADTTVLELDLASPEMQALIAPAQESARKCNEIMAGFHSRVDKEMEDVYSAIRAAEVFLANDYYMMDQIASLRSALAQCSAPGLDRTAHKYLRTSEPEALKDYEASLDRIRSALARARRAAAAAGKGTTIVIGPILDDLRGALRELLSVRGYWE